MKTLILITMLALAVNAFAGSPRIYSSDGTFLGNLNSNQFDPDSINNPYGEYGNPFSPNSIKNPFSEYGNKFNPDSVNSPYGGSDLKESDSISEEE